MSKIVIIGAGNVGGSVAEELATEHELSVIDLNPTKLNKLRSRMDALFIQGSAESPEVLERAGCADADIILNVTDSDFTNLASSRICKTLYSGVNVSATEEMMTRIVRVRNKELSNNKEVMDAFNVNLSFNPETYVAQSMAGAVRHVGTDKLLMACNGVVSVAWLEIKADSPAHGKSIAQLHAESPKLRFEICAVRRGQHFASHDPDKNLSAGEDLMVVCAAEDMLPTLNLLRKPPDTTSDVFIAGGGPIGEALARELEDDFSVTLMEPNRERCALLAQNLGSTLVHEADPTDIAVLKSEEIENSRYFCAVSESEETNMLSSLLAKQLGCAYTAVPTNRSGFENVLRKYGIDTVVSPSELTSQILKEQLASRSYTNEHEIGESDSKLLEIKAQDNSDLVGQPFAKVAWPENTIPCAMVRSKSKRDQEEVGAENDDSDEPRIFLPNDEETIQPKDICLVYLPTGDTSLITRLADKPAMEF